MSDYYGATRKPLNIDFGPAVEKMRERADAKAQAERERIAQMPKRIAELESRINRMQKAIVQLYAYGLAEWPPSPAMMHALGAEPGDFDPIDSTDAGGRS